LTGAVGGGPLSTEVLKRKKESRTGKPYKKMPGRSVFWKESSPWGNGEHPGIFQVRKRTGLGLKRGETLGGDELKTCRTLCGTRFRGRGGVQNAKAPKGGWFPNLENRDGEGLFGPNTSKGGHIWNGVPKKNRTEPSGVNLTW